jgi:hypothetical protein
MSEPDLIVNIDGNLTLDQTKNRCFVEQNGGFQLQSIENAILPQGGEPLMVNKAEFVENLHWLKTLLFLEPGPDNPETVKTQKKAQGWTLLCSGAIYVQNEIKNVMVFAK